MRPTPAATCRGRPASWQYPTAPRRSVACYHRSSKLLTDSRLSVSRVFLTHRIGGTPADEFIATRLVAFIVGGMWGGRHVRTALPGHADRHSASVGREFATHRPRPRLTENTVRHGPPAIRAHSMNALLRSTGFPRDDDAETSARSPQAGPGRVFVTGPNNATISSSDGPAEGCTSAPSCSRRKHRASSCLLAHVVDRCRYMPRGSASPR